MFSKLFYQPKGSVSYGWVKKKKNTKTKKKEKTKKEEEDGCLFCKDIAYGKTIHLFFSFFFSFFFFFIIIKLKEEERKF